MERQFTIAEAKSRLPAIIHSVEDGPSVKLTRHGKPVAVLLSIREYEQLAKNNMGFWSAFTKFRKILEQEDLKITDADFKDLRDISTSREREIFK
ncbi:MAG: type II toxin-antitoxin system Phd/YefM family antitoxin [bacterium]|nr:type II toxin-antitoxin system Phd/YefM family antitoxin [bacterium]